MNLLLRIALFFTAVCHLELYSQEDAVLLSSDSEVFFQKKQLVHRHSFRIKINNESGSNYAKVSIPYVKGDKVDILDARLVNSDGKTLKKLRKKEIQDRSNLSSISFHDEGMSRDFELFYHSFPYEFHYTYEHAIEKYISLVHWTPLKSRNLKVEEASLDVRLPSEMKIRIDAHPSLTFHVDSTSSEKHLRWSVSDVDLPNDEVFAAPLQNRIPSVYINPIEFEYGIEGRMDSWKSFGDWLYALNQGRDELTPQEKIIVDNLIREASTERDIVDILYRYMQDNTRYISVALGIGGMQPHPAMHVCEIKYGDCKDLSNYMQSLLAYAGIKSYYVVVNAGDPIPKINRQFPSQQFNHVILCVPLQSDTIWLENTSDINPPGYLGTFTQNRYGLLVDQNNSHLIHIPSLDSGDVLSECRYVIHGDAEKKQFLMEVQGRFRGDKYEYLKQVVKEQDQPLMKSALKNILAFPLQDITSVHTREYASAKIEILATGTLDRLMRKVGNLYFASIPPLDLHDLEAIPSRRAPIQIDYPINIIDTIEIQGMKSADFDLPQNLITKSKYGSYHDQFKEVAGSIQLIRRFHLKAGNYALSEYEKFFEFIDRLKKHTETLHISFSL